MGILNFLNRNRNKLLFVGGAAGAAIVVLNKVLANYEKQWQSSSSRGFVHDVRKKEIHFENIIDECNQLCLKVCPRILSHIQSLLDVQNLIKQSKNQDKSIQSKVEVWKLLKVKILTRLLSELYCNCILICYMRMLKSVAGGRIFATTVQVDSSNSGSSSASVADLTHIKIYTKLNSLMASMDEKKFDCLIQPIEEAVEETLRGFSVDYKIGIEDFKDILEKIKKSMSFYLISPSFKASQLFLETNSTLEDSTTSLNESEHIMLHNILTESQNILESDEFKSVLESSIEVAYELLLNELQVAFIRMNKKLNSSDPVDELKLINPNNIKLPIVKILPQIIENHSERNEADIKASINYLLSLDVINCYAANVYEEFCFS